MVISPSSSLGAIVLRFKANQIGYLKHSKVDESWQNLACAKEAKCKAWGRGRGVWGTFPLPPFSPWNLAVLPERMRGGKSHACSSSLTGWRLQSDSQRMEVWESFCVSKTLTPLMRQMFGPGLSLQGELKLIKQQDNFLSGMDSPYAQPFLAADGLGKKCLLSSSPVPPGDSGAEVQTCGLHSGGFDLWLTFREACLWLWQPVASPSFL